MIYCSKIRNCNAQMITRQAFVYGLKPGFLNSLYPRHECRGKPAIVPVILPLPRDLSRGYCVRQKTGFSPLLFFQQINSFNDGHETPKQALETYSAAELRGTSLPAGRFNHASRPPTSSDEADYVGRSPKRTRRRIKLLCQLSISDFALSLILILKQFYLFVSDSSGIVQPLPSVTIKYHRFFAVRV